MNTNDFHLSPTPYSVTDPLFYGANIMGLRAGSPTFKILIVDDSPPNRDLLRQLLSPIGFTLKQANNGKEALREYQHWQPDLILMDNRMPLMSGTEAIREIRLLEADKNSSNTSVPIIAISASAFEEDRDKIMKEGANEFIRKPFKAQEVLDKIGSLLNLEYVYQNVEESAESPELSPEILTKAVEALPAELIKQLCDAATMGDGTRFKELLAELDNSSDEAAALLTILQRLVASYDFDSISRLIDP